MKYIILGILALGLSGCGVGWVDSVPDGYYGSSTTVGIDVGLPEGLSLVIGYRKHEGVICKNETDILIQNETKAGTSGLDTSQSIAFGKGVAHSEDISINE